MNSSSHLNVFPSPDQAAQAHSQRLVDHLVQHIRQEGSITLGEYIHKVLYTPGLGYYAAGAKNFGEEGDFITAPELGDVFAMCCARAIARVIEPLEKPVVMELGAGSGRFAFDVLSALDSIGSLPSQYRILEVSAELRLRQESLLQDLPAHVSRRVEWLEAPSHEPFDGVIIGNEVVDALPFERFTVNSNGDLSMDVVSLDDAQLRIEQTPATALVQDTVNALRERLRQRPEGLDELSSADVWTVPYTSELRLDLQDWLASVTQGLRRGAVLLIDYGSDCSEVYASDRSMGTALCHYRHRAHEDLLWWPGLQDITAWVDFSQLADAALALNFEIDGYTTQAHALLDFGLDEVVAEKFELLNEPQDLKGQLAMAQQIKQLTLPGEMGERFKVIGFSRGVPQGMLSSSHINLAGRL